MKRTFNIPHPPLSVNKLTYRDKRHKSAAAVDWIYDVVGALNNPTDLQSFKDLRDHFDPKVHAISIDLTFLYPKSKLFTQRGTISAKSHDLSNVEKPIIDVLFLPQYNKPAPHGVANLNLDDKYIVDLKSKKRMAENSAMIIEIEIIEIEKLEH